MARNTESTALALPDDVRKELLEAQKQSIGSIQRLPGVNIMGNAVCLFEFDDTSETTNNFRGVILANHPRNVLWDRKFGAQDVPEDERFPACSSPDGKFGTPRPGFLHEALGREARGDELIDCSTCLYNKFGSGNKLIADKNPKGKATSNYRSVYVLTEARQSPVELSLPATSLPPFDEYLTSLLNRGVPVQAVLTEFTQVKKTKGSMKWGVAQFKMVRNLTQEEFALAMEARRTYMDVMTPASTDPMAGSNGMEGSEVGDENEDDLPF